MVAAIVTLSSLNDNQLVTLVNQGNQKAFEVIVKRYHARLYQVILRYVKNEAKAQDALQNTFFAAYRNISQFEGNSNLYTWLCRIAINNANCRTAKRAERFNNSYTSRNTEEGEDNRGVEDFSSNENLEETLANRQIEALRKNALTKAIAKLSAEYREVLEADLAGISNSNLALFLDLPLTTIKSRLVYARRLVANQVSRELAAA